MVRWLRSRQVSNVTLGGSIGCLLQCPLVGASGQRRDSRLRYRQAKAFGQPVSTRPLTSSYRGRLPHPRTCIIETWWSQSASREISPAEIRTTLGADSEPNVLGAQLNQRLRDGQEVQASVRAIKEAVSASATRLGAAHIDLFIAAPAAFAVALGHRWNGLPPTQLYEYLPAERRYVATAMLSGIGH